jgi:hypothetical protein
MRLSDIAKLTPLFYGIIILCGALYLDVFYGVFNTNIFKYVDLTEILVSFINVIVTMLRLFAIIILLVIIEIIVIKNLLKHKKLVKISSQIHILFEWYKKNKIVGIFICTILTIIYLFVTGSNSVEDKVKYYNVIFWASFIINIIIILIEFEHNNNEGKREYTYLIVYLVLALFISTAWEAVGSAKNLIDNSKRETVTIVTSDTTIVTTKEYYYVGRTNKYIFLYDSLDKHRDVIPVDNIKLISFKYNNEEIKKNDLQTWKPL